MLFKYLDFNLFCLLKEYEGRNLVEFDAISASKFITGVMEILFTRAERFNGICTANNFTS